jgi:putative ABC transport system permease protein
LVKSLATIDAPGIFRLAYGSTILPRAQEVVVNVRVFGIALGIAAITSLVFGVLPAFHLSATNHLQAMGTRASGRTRRESRARTVLAVGQLVLATVLLVGAGLLANSFMKLSTVDKGYDPTNVLAFQLVIPAEYSTTRKAETIETLLAWLRAKPDVQSAGFAYSGILLGIQDTVGVFVPPGKSFEDMRREVDKPRLKSLSQGYLEAAGVTLLNGRLFDGRDHATAPPAVVINRRVASSHFPGSNPVGQTLTWHNGGGTGIGQPAVVQVVGVIDDVRQGSIEREPYGEIFMDYRQVLALHESWGFKTPRVEQISFGFLSFAVRTRGEPAAAIPVVREAVASLDRNLGLDAIVPLERLVGNSVARQRFYAVMLGVFASVAGLLAAIGIYGVLAYAVMQRTQEIGVRMALGAERRQVLGLVLRKGLMLVTLGLTLGLAGAAAGARSLQTMLFGIEPLDVGTFAGVAVGFTLVALLASYLPARRATKVDPMVALRVD